MSDFSAETARSWMRGAVELARDLRTGEVIAAELAERCALAFGQGEAGGPLVDAGHWLHAIAREVAAAAAPLSELVLVRTRHHGRTYWTIADATERRTYAPHVAQRQAIAKFEDETGRRHAKVTLYRVHRTPAEVLTLLAKLFGDAA